MTRARLPALLLALTIAAPLRAQTAAQDSAALARVAAHLDAGRLDSARVTLAQWQGRHAPTARARERAAADMLAARLERDGVAAQHAWLALALAHPFSSEAGIALLRVGQAAVLQGDTATAVVYLTRLIDDFPGSGNRAEAHLWLSRAYVLAGQGSTACEAAREGLAAGSSSEVARLLRLQEERACAMPAGVAAAPAPQAAAPAGAPPAASADARFAVQAGAFRTRSAADELMRQLVQADFEPRLVRVPANDLMRVRIGALRTSSEAAALRDRVRAAGFDAVVVSDATSESAVR